MAALKVEGISDVEAFALFIREDIGNYRMNFVNKRYQQLMQSAVNKKKVDGVFTLHEGFKKDCGLKGGKLSGGQK